MKEKILDILKNSKDYISGEDISKELGISRAAVWKYIKKLRSEGYGIKSFTNRGYCLEKIPDMMSDNEIKKNLKTKYIGHNIVMYEETDSTNERAKKNSGLVEGSVFIAEIQTNGKGSRGRGWVSPRGEGIWFTVLLKPDISLSEVSQITLIAGIAVCKAIGMGSKIKWPNDIVIDGKKVCGILTEMSAEIDMINYVVCGIGINVNNENFDEEIKDRATSVYLQSGEKQNRNELAARVLNNFEFYYDKFMEEGFSSVIDEYKNNCTTIGREVKVLYKKESVDGTAVDIDNNGALLVEKDGKIITVTSGEVSVRGIYGYV